MDGLPVFESFLSTQFGLTANRASDETVVFINSFTALFDTYDADIHDLVKSTHITNLDCPANGKFMILASEIVSFKALLF